MVEQAVQNRGWLVSGPDTMGGVLGEQASSGRWSAFRIVICLLISAREGCPPNPGHLIVFSVGWYPSEGTVSRPGEQSKVRTAGEIGRAGSELGAPTHWTSSSSLATVSPFT